MKYFKLFSSAINALLAMNLDPITLNEKKDDGFTALHLAAFNGNLEVAEALIRKVSAALTTFPFRIGIFLLPKPDHESSEFKN